MINAYSEIKNTAFSPARHAFTRRGSYFGLVTRPQRHAPMAELGTWGTADLYVAIGHGGAAAMPSNLSMLLVPVHHGVIIPFTLRTSPTELEILTGYGTISCCFAEPTLLLMKGENGLGLLVEADMSLHKTMKCRGENSWECSHTPACSFVYTAVDGEFRMKADWDMERLCTPQARGEVIPDEDGKFLFAIEEFSHCGYKRSSFPGYSEGLRDAKADWDEYLSKMPDIPQYASTREPAAYLTWAMLLDPCCRIKHPQICRDFGHAATTWQSCQNAVAVSGNLPLAIDLLLSQLDEQSPDGQIPVFCDDTRGLFQTVTVPAQGWTLEYLMHKYDLAKEVPAEKLTALYDGFSKWVRWYDIYRDDNHDGIPQYESSEECGAEGSPLFSSSNMVELPDLCAFLALLEEKLGDLAGMIGRNDESNAWYDRSRARIESMIRTFWNGKRFVGRVCGTGEPLANEALLFFRPLILGKRLPAEIIDAMMEDLSEGNGFLTSGGMTAIRMTSREFSRLNAATGRVIPAENLLIATGMFWAGKKREAQELANRFCTGIIEPISASIPVERGIGDSWTAAVFQTMAELAEEAANRGRNT